MLGALGYRLAEIEIVTDIASARAQILRVADLVGHPDRGAKLVRDLDAARARLASRARLPFSTALIVERGHIVLGAGG